MPQQITVAILVGGLGFGGAERQLFNFLKYSDKTGFRYHIVVLNKTINADYGDAIARLGHSVWYCPDRVRGMAARLRWITLLLRRIHPYIAHSWSFYTNPYFYIAGILASIPVRLGSLRNQPSQIESNLAPIMRWLAYRGSGLIVNSQRAREQVLHSQRKKSHVYLVENGIEIPEEIENLDITEFGFTSDQRIVATVGNLQKVKNQRMFIDAMPHVIRRCPDVRCLIVGQSVPGEAEMQDTLQTYIDQQNLSDKIILTGMRHDVLNIMNTIKVFCHTSLSEGTPNAVLEAMAMKCPVISTAVGDVPNIIESGRNGVLIESGDTNALAESVIELLENEAHAEAIAQAGFETVRQRFGCDRMARNIESIYVAALKDNTNVGTKSRRGMLHERG